MSDYKATGAAYDRGREAGFAAGYEAGKQPPETEYQYGFKYNPPSPDPEHVYGPYEKDMAETLARDLGGVLHRRPVGEWEEVPDGE